MTAEGLTYDTGALVAAERSDRLVWSLHRAALARGLPPAVPAGVLAEGWRGGPQATLSRFLKGCDVEDLTKEQAREVGGLAARANHDDVIDVSVVEGAVRRRHAVVTSNRSDIAKVADAAGVTLEIQAI
ncbi:MAG: twitching motility protein PilT [Actinobacteria bacterium]|nr:twitching motility protein PilT [Actinomycetota bacterium]